MPEDLSASPAPSPAPSAALSAVPEEERLPAPDRVHRYLKQRILSGELAGGEMTSEGEIAAALGVSRTPVREALRRLQAESLVRVYPKRGVQVVPIGPREAQDVLDARRLVESHAAARLAAAADAERERLFDRLEELLEAQQAAVDAHDLDAYARHDTDFHLAIIEAGGNALLTQFARSLRERQQRLTARGVDRDASRAGAFIAGHRALLAHLREREAEGYARELDAHLDAVRARLA